MKELKEYAKTNKLGITVSGILKAKLLNNILKKIEKSNSKDTDKKDGGNKNANKKPKNTQNRKTKTSKQSNDTKQTKKENKKESNEAKPYNDNRGDYESLIFFFKILCVFQMFCDGKMFFQISKSGKPPQKKQSPKFNPKYIKNCH